MTQDERERRERMAVQSAVERVMDGGNAVDARTDTLRRTALMGLKHQLHQITNNNHFDRAEVIADLKRAIRFLEEEV